MQYRPLTDAILALLVAFALATTPALSRAPGDSAWNVRAAGLQIGASS